MVLRSKKKWIIWKNNFDIFYYPFIIWNNISYINELYEKFKIHIKMRKHNIWGIVSYLANTKKIPHTQTA